MLVEPARERQRTAVSKPPGGREAHSDPGVLRHLWGGFDSDCSFVAVRLNQLRRDHEQASWNFSVYFLPGGLFIGVF